MAQGIAFAEMAGVEAREGARPGPTLHANLFEPVPLRALWALLNRSHHVDGAALRVACLLLLITYVISSIVRHLPEPEALAIRAAVIVYTLIGIIFAPRFNWSALRSYSAGMALLLPATTAALTLLRGNHPADLALSALSIFVPMIFLQAAADVLAVAALLAVGILAFVTVWVPQGVPIAVAGIVLFGALVAGAATAIVLIAFRGRVSESTAWWQDACARERALREFVELAAPHLGDQVLAREFAARLHGSFGTGHCAIVLTDAGSGMPHVAATAGAVAGRPPGAIEVPTEALAALLGAVANRQPLVRQPLSALDLRQQFAALPWMREGGTAVVLPFGTEEAVAGAIVLSAPAPRPVDDEELLLWRAMANQVGVAIGSARLFARVQDALRARSEFINTMSHELRSPLHVILGYADMLADGAQDPAFIAARVRASALEVLQLLENTLVAARLGAGKVRVEATSCRLEALVGDLRESAAALPDAAPGVALRWELGEGPAVVRIDRLKVKEIVHNLVSNALKFTREGEVIVRLGGDDRQLRIDVEDTGSGIPREAQARIFEMFERVETAQAPRAPGAGLGLYIVKNLVQMMGGTLAVNSEPGRGSRFTVWLPTNAAAAQRA